MTWELAVSVMALEMGPEILTAEICVANRSSLAEVIGWTRARASKSLLWTRRNVRVSEQLLGGTGSSWSRGGYLL